MAGRCVHASHEVNYRSGRRHAQYQSSPNARRTCLTMKDTFNTEAMPPSVANLVEFKSGCATD